MFRVTPYVIHARSLLYRRAPADFQHLNVSRLNPQRKYLKPQEREPCPPPQPPPPPKPKDDTLLWGVMTLMFLAGGFVIYAKTNPEIRDMLTIYAPWFDDIIAILYQENMSYKEFMGKCIEDLQLNLKDYLEQEQPKECSSDGKIIKDITPPGDEGKIKETEDDVEKKKTACDKMHDPIITKDICEVEKCLKELGDTILLNYKNARDACLHYNKMVEDTMMSFTFKGLQDMMVAMQERLALVQKYMDNIAAAKAKMDEVARYLDCGVATPKRLILNAKELVKEYKIKFKTNEIQFQWENDKSYARDKQLQTVDRLLDKYVGENQTMFKDLKYESSKPVLQGDPDLLLHHTKRYAEQSRLDLQEALAGMTERINRSLDSLPKEKKSERDAEINSQYAKRKADLDSEFKKRFDDQKAANEKLLKDSLKKQLERHEAELEGKLQQKEQQAGAKLEKMVAEKVAAEKRLLAHQLREMALKVQLVEEKLEARLKVERETRRSQELWSAGASLLAATKKGDPFVNVEKELNAIEKASGGGQDKLVTTVLKSIPPSVREQGVVPESVLRAKYHVMEQSALRVAMVEQEGAPMPVYFLSYLQSLMLFMKIPGIPQDEYDKPPKQPPKNLDTFDLLQRARFWVERGNIAAALRYVNSLEGASRLAAAAWNEAARAHLETRQAAEAVIAHAAALGMQYI